MRIVLDKFLNLEDLFLSFLILLESEDSHDLFVLQHHELLNGYPFGGNGDANSISWDDLLRWISIAVYDGLAGLLQFFIPLQQFLLQGLFILIIDAATGTDDV